MQQSEPQLVVIPLLHQRHDVIAMLHGIRFFQAGHQVGLYTVPESFFRNVDIES